MSTTTPNPNASPSYWNPERRRILQERLQALLERETGGRVALQVGFITVRATTAASRGAADTILAIMSASPYLKGGHVTHRPAEGDYPEHWNVSFAWK